MGDKMLALANEVEQVNYNVISEGISDFIKRFEVFEWFEGLFINISKATGIDVNLVYNGDKINKKGKYIVKFINSKLETYYIKIKVSRIGLIIFIFLILGIILGSINCIYNNRGIDNPKNVIEQVIDYNIELEGIKYVFNVSFKNQEFKSIELTDKVSDNKFIYPGSSGFFLHRN